MSDHAVKELSLTGLPILFRQRKWQTRVETSTLCNTLILFAVLEVLGPLSRRFQRPMFDSLSALLQAKFDPRGVGPDNCECVLQFGRNIANPTLWLGYHPKTILHVRYTNYWFSVPLFQPIHRSCTLGERGSIKTGGPLPQQRVIFKGLWLSAWGSSSNISAGTRHHFAV